MPWYPYSRAAGGVLLPMIAVRLWNGDRSVRLVAVVDSGADTSLLDATVARRLGLDRSTAVRTVMAGADGTAFGTLRWPDTPLEFEFQGQRIPFNGAFAEFAPGADTASLLGRNDFFQRFIVQFWDAAGLMNIDLSPDFPLASLA